MTSTACVLNFMRSDIGEGVVSGGDPTSPNNNSSSAAARESSLCLN